ncbi:unnamed protein product [Clonostachys rhizophaga]|uniref:Uncharacterized protein n=1 Tax=Clonostachys rhizophaga TaxID=160324 RepID=A0A9N9YPS2_9HYPO|nr:unnamed protein product [Clonostachys rhizophaga]
MASQPQDLDNQPLLAIRDNDAQDHPNTAADSQLHNSDDFLENENEDHGSSRQPQKPSRKSQLSDRVVGRVLALQLGGDTSRETKSIELTEFSREAPQGDSSATLLQPSDSEDEPTEEDTAAPQPATWSPLWLKQPVLGVFLLLFFSCTVAFPILLSYSEKPRGLGRAELSATDVWRFAPTAVLTVITIFWSRVELQALRYMPWAIARDSPRGSEWKDLDYTTMIPPVLLFRSFQNRHFLVFFAALATALLRVQVVLSTNLFKISLRGVPEPIEVNILDSFDTVIDEPVSQISMDAYYNAVAVRDFQMNLPFGASKQAAYQTFNTREPMRDPVTVVVDGLFTHVECKLLTNYTNPPRRVSPDKKPMEKSFHYVLDMEFEGCPSPTAVRSPFMNWIDEDLRDTNFWILDHMGRGGTRCPSLPQETDHFVYLTGHWSATPKNKSISTLDNLAAVLCAPRASISKVEVVADTTSQNMTVLQDQGEPKIVNSDPWPFLEWSIPENSKRWVGIPRLDHRWDDILPGPFLTTYDLQGEMGSPSSDGSDSSVYNSQNLYQSILNITSQMSPLVAHYQLKRNASDVAQGSVSRKHTILHVDRGIGIAMTIIFACCASIALLLGLRSRSVFGTWHRDPATLLGSMTFFQEMGHSAAEAQAEKDGNRKLLWAAGSYSPMILRPWYRLLFVVYTLALIIALNATHQRSTAANGIATVGGNPSSSFLWTFIPALAMLVVALHANATDTTVRSLSTILALSRRSCTAVELDVYLLDMLGLKAWYYSLRSRILSVTLAQSIAIICAFLTTISTLLFTPNPTSHSYQTEFDQRTWFTSVPSKETLDYDRSLTRLSVSALLTISKRNNFTYPPWTYNDMVFPELSMDTSDGFWGSNTVVKAHNMPAARLSEDCKEVPKSELTIEARRVDGNGENNEGENGELQTRAVANITQTRSCPGRSPISTSNASRAPWRKASQPAASAALPFAKVLRSLYCESRPRNASWEVVTYAWGSFSEATPSFDHLSVQRCNYSWVEVPTNVSLIQADGSIQFDHTDPPIRAGEERPWGAPFQMPAFNATGDEDKKYTSVWPLLSVASGQEVLEMGSQFNVILQPYGTLTPDDLGSPERQADVLAEITSLHRIAAAQLVHKENRLRTNQTSTVAPFRHGELSPVQARILRTGAIRLFQSEPATLALTLILSLTVSVHIWALVYTLFRYLFRDRIPFFPWDVDLKGLAPYRFNSVAMVSSLLEGSNYAEILPKRAYQMYPPELHEYFSGTFFRLGWFVGQKEKGKVFTVGIMDDKKFRPSAGDDAESVYANSHTAGKRSRVEEIPSS